MIIFLMTLNKLAPQNTSGSFGYSEEFSIENIETFKSLLNNEEFILQIQQLILMFSNNKPGLIFSTFLQAYIGMKDSEPDLNFWELFKSLPVLSRLFNNYSAISLMFAAKKVINKEVDNVTLRGLLDTSTSINFLDKIIL